MSRILASIGVAIAVAFVCAGSSFAQDLALLAGSEIKGATVKNLQDEEIGVIDEILIEPTTGRIRFAVLSVGGFLGLGSTTVAVPWTAFQISKDGDKTKYVLDATKERLEKAPKVEGKNYERLYARETAEPIFIYWEETWVVEP
jgi:PRC-barrel domain